VLRTQSLGVLGWDTVQGLVPRFHVLAEDFGDWFLSQVLRLE
jgi:hypothetical protein